MGAFLCLSVNCVCGRICLEMELVHCLFQYSLPPAMSAVCVRRRGKCKTRVYICFQ